jgi:hypothetical protein
MSVEWKREWEWEWGRGVYDRQLGISAFVWTEGSSTFHPSLAYHRQRHAMSHHSNIYGKPWSRYSLIQVFGREFSFITNQPLI